MEGKNLKKINYLKSSNLLCFGSNRRVKVKIKKLAVEAKKRNLFLMLSEGDLVECIPLTKFIIKLSKEFPKAYFVIRFHPITKIKRLVKSIPELLRPPKNVELSNFSFDDDLKRAHYAIYRGSTTIIKAIQYGLVPLYYEKPNEISIDPLYEIQNEKINIKSPDDIKILQKYHIRI